MQLVSRGDPLYRNNLCLMRLNRKYKARANGFTVHLNRAGAADAVFASHMRSMKPQLMPNEVGQKHPRFNFSRYALSIHGSTEFNQG